MINLWHGRRRDSTVDVDGRQQLYLEVSTFAFSIHRHRHMHRSKSVLELKGGSVTASIDNQLVSVKSPGFAEIDKPFSLFS
jgi:hypothetical protein